MGKGKDKRVIKPSNTKYISRMLYREEFQGMAADSCWLFKTMNGTISGYTFVAEKDIEVLLFIQKDNGELLKFTN